MSKKIIILGTVFLLTMTGCSVEYNLTIDAENYEEKTDIMTDTSLEVPEVYQDKNLIDYFDLSQNEYYEPIYFNPANYNFYEGGYQNGTVYYDLKGYQNGNFKGLTLSHTFDNNDFYRSNAIKSCFDELDIQRQDEYILIRTSNKCKIFDNYSILNNITVKIKTSLEVIVTNADSVDDNVYTWNITRENYNNKPIRLTLAKSDDTSKEITNPLPEENQDSGQTDNDNKTEKKDNSKYNIIIIGGAFIILGGVILASIKFKKK